MLKQVFLAHFEPVLTEFSLFHHMYAPLCALRTYLGAVWWSHLELGEGCRIYIYGIRWVPPPPLGTHGPGLGGDQGPPPPYFWVEKLKKRGIRVIRDSGRAQFQDLGPDLGANLAVISGALPWVLGLPKGPFWAPLWCPMLVSADRDHD